MDKNATKFPILPQVPYIRKKGFSLISVLAIGAISSILIGAMFTGLVPVYKQVCNVQGEIIADNATLSATNYMVALLNSDRTKWDCPSSQGSMFYDFVQLFPDSTAGINYPWKKGLSKLNVTVTRISSSDLQQFASPALKPEDITAPPGNWRLLDVNAQYGVTQKSIKVLLRPRSVISSNAALSLQGTPGAPVSSLFTSAISANGSLMLGPETRVLSQNGDLGASVTATSSAALAADKINGKVYLYGQKFPSPQSQAPQITLNQDTKVKEAIYFSAAAAAQGLTVTNGSDPYKVGPNYDNIENVTQNQQPQDSDFNIVSAGTSKLPALDSLPAPEFISPPPSGITIVSANGSQGSSAQIPILGSVNSTSNASGTDYQLYYNGTGTISIRSKSSTSDVRMTIFAPNATVLIGQDPVNNFNGKVKFQGAIVARNIAGYIGSDGKTPLPTRGVDFTFNPDLANPQSPLTQASGLFRPTSINWNLLPLEVFQIISMK